MTTVALPVRGQTLLSKLRAKRDTRENKATTINDTSTSSCRGTYWYPLLPLGLTSTLMNGSSTPVRPPSDNDSTGSAEAFQDLAFCLGADDICGPKSNWGNMFSKVPGVGTLFGAKEGQKSTADDEQVDVGEGGASPEAVPEQEGGEAEAATALPPFPEAAPVRSQASPPSSPKEKQSRKKREDGVDSKPKKKKSIKKKESVPATGSLSPKAKGKKKKSKSTLSEESSSRAEDHSASQGDDHQLEEEDVDAMLANLEIPDFSMSGMLPSQDDEDEDTFDPNQKEPWTQVDWKERLRRQEIYSQRYKPKRTEIVELEALANDLGISSSSDLLGIKRMSMAMGMGSRMTEDIHKLFSGEHSILVSVLPVQWDGKKCDLVLLTDGFVLKYAKPASSFNPLESRYETCQLWESVDFCEQSGAFSISIQLLPEEGGEEGTRYELDAIDGGETLDTIFQRLERVMTQHDLHGKSDQTDVLGWQHLRARKPAFAVAVSNDLGVLEGKSQVSVSKEINELDSYNHYSPLHYAILQEECNHEVLKVLLKAGADPNLEDGDGKSAMYYGKHKKECLGQKATDSRFLHFYPCVWQPNETNCRKVSWRFSRMVEVKSRS